MKAMIFAAGLGTRLFPLTNDKPKALVEVAGKTLLQRAVEYVSFFGFKDIIINTHHFADKIEQFVENHRFEGVKITLSHEPDLLDTAGGLAKAASFFDEEPFLIYNVDIVTDIDLGAMLEYHKNSGADVTLAVQKRTTSRYLLFDDERNLKGWINKSTGEKILCETQIGGTLHELAFGGIHIFSPRILPLLGEVRKWSLVPFYLQIAGEVKIKAYEINNDNFWFDCGKPETLKACEQRLLHSVSKKTS